jgi:hypothetical protein
MIRSLLLILGLLYTLTSFASRQTFDKLCEVNPQWALRPDARPESLPAYPQLNEYGWIALYPLPTSVPGSWPTDSAGLMNCGHTACQAHFPSMNTCRSATRYL